MSPRPLPARLRKFIGLFAILGFCTAYVATVVTLGDHIPAHWAVQGAFYGTTGLLWGFPLFPLIRWMNRE